MPVPADCSDGFAQAYFARPERLLESAARRADSDWAFIGNEAETRATSRLRAELDCGAWDACYEHLRRLAEYDGGLRLIISAA